MRRCLLAILLLSVSASVFAGVADMQDDQHRGMGVRGNALSDSYGTMFANPASLVFNPGSISASLWVTDNGYVNEPSSGLMLSFCGRRIRPNPSFLISSPKNDISLPFLLFENSFTNDQVLSKQPSDNPKFQNLFYLIRNLPLKSCRFAATPCPCAKLPLSPHR